VWFISCRGFRRGRGDNTGKILNAVVGSPPGIYQGFVDVVEVADYIPKGGGRLNGKAQPRWLGLSPISYLLHQVYGVEHNYHANYFGAVYRRKLLWRLGKIFFGVSAGY
jgi:hypothetical protein